MVRLSRELYRVYDQNGNKNCIPWSQTHLQVGYIGGKARVCCDSQTHDAFILQDRPAKLVARCAARRHDLSKTQSHALVRLIDGDKLVAVN